MCAKSQIVTLWNLMRRFGPEYFVFIAQGIIGMTSPVDPSAALENDIKAKGIACFADYKTICVAFGLKASAITIEKLLDLYAAENSTYEQHAKLIAELQGRIVDELHSECFLALTTPEAARFNQWGNGWESIMNRFPDTMRDLEEMNKCFALGRYTASMFHALHVAEWGAISLGDFIGVTDPKKGWGPTEKTLRELIRGGHSMLPASLAGKFDFLEQMNREIDSMVLSWRHKVDHAANHLAIVPNTDFTPDIAEHIIGAVRIFMQRLIEGIPASTPGATALSR